MAYHFTGIKGTGMAALAEILHEKGLDVKGSDIEKYVFTEEGLKERNIPILPFDPANIHENDTVIVGLSFGEDHPEVQAARKTKGVEVFWYNEFLGKLLEDYTSICVAGCHGKSTTTGILASVLEKGDSTGFLIGDGHGHMPAAAKNFVLESCEFQRHFLAYHPDYAIITNIELDHVDYYKDMDDYISAFQSFVDQVKKGVVIFGDDPYLPKLNCKVPVVTYGLKDGNDFQAVNLVQSEAGIEYDVMHKGEKLISMHLPEIGMPFVWNSLGAFALAYTLGMEPEKIYEGLLAYQGINRRFVVEEAGDSILIDDYAHHPTAIRLLIEAARNKYPGRKVVALYKPDRYSRLQFFLDGFAESLNTADEQAVLDFDANAKPEDDTITVTIGDLLEKLDNGHLMTISEEDAKKLADMGPAVYLFMSSKNIYLLKDLLKQYWKKD